MQKPLDEVAFCKDKNGMEHDGMLEQLPDYLGAVATVITVVLAYFFGRRQAEHERLYEERARAIAGLFERYTEVDMRFYSLVHPFDAAGEPDKKEKARLAAESFNELLVHYRRNSIWLSRRTGKQVSDFIERYRKTFRNFQGDRGYPDDIRKWSEVWHRFEKESPEIKYTLEEEFRASLGDTRAKLSVWRRRIAGNSERSAIGLDDLRSNKSQNDA